MFPTERSVYLLHHYTANYYPPVYHLFRNMKQRSDPIKQAWDIRGRTSYLRIMTSKR